mmetsp:Transcript_257/g.719  ORF Transcript_257/g.719 Transcript_257/m.719 type:complete len:293 (-) Transcript_257:381-1259(-)
MSTMLTGESREALERQLRFYFSDANLRRDKFMRAQLGAEGREWMEVAVFVRFNRVAALTTDATQISLALAGIAEVELDESRARVRRACAVAAVTDASSSAQARRTVYVENLLMGTEQAELESLLRESVGPLSYVALPRFDWPASRPSKGYAFVEFDDERDAIRATTARVLMRRKAPAAAAAAAGAGATLPSIAAAAVAAAAAAATVAVAVAARTTPLRRSPCPLRRCSLRPLSPPGSPSTSVSRPPPPHTHPPPHRRHTPRRPPTHTLLPPRTLPPLRRAQSCRRRPLRRRL